MSQLLSDAKGKILGHNIAAANGQRLLRSRKINIVDWILLRLLVGGRLTCRAIIELGHGRLLQDIRERGMRRDVKEMEICLQSQNRHPIPGWLGGFAP